QSLTFSLCPRGYSFSSSRHCTPFLPLINGLQCVPLINRTLHYKQILSKYARKTYKKAAKDPFALLTTFLHSYYVRVFVDKFALLNVFRLDVSYIMLMFPIIFMLRLIRTE